MAKISDTYTHRAANARAQGALFRYGFWAHPHELNFLYSMAAQKYFVTDAQVDTINDLTRQLRDRRIAHPLPRFVLGEHV